MKFFICAALSLTLIFSSLAVTFASPVPLRGVVEGFYGKPWTFDDREDLMLFSRQHSLNAYIYAPKNDPYHRDKWREPYPASQVSELKNLVAAAKNNGVRFIFAVSPGLDLNYKGKKGDADFNSMIQKLEMMYGIGVRDFAIFFDDLKDSNGNHHENGKLHAEFINKIQKTLRANHKDIGQFLTVPTEYYFEDMMKGDKVTSYTKNFAATLDKNIIVLYTGDGVVCDGISDKQFAAANKAYGRELGIWWNYPVNDYTLTEGGDRNAKLALGAIEKLPTKNVKAIFFNPMGQAKLSRIALATGADYANAPEIYDAQKSWDKALQNQFGGVAKSMKVFANHSQHMENNWAKIGPPDGKNFETAAYLVLSAIRHNRQPDFRSIEILIDEMELAAYDLQQKLPPEILKECKPQLEQFLRIIKADRIALMCLESKKFNPELKVMREEISAHEKSAILSEKSALKFIDDVIELMDKSK